MLAPPNTYAARNEILAEIGYPSYEAYLKSPLWLLIKRLAFEYHGTRCKTCPRAANVMHHKGYGRSTLDGGTLEHLIPLCDSCHYQVEFEKSGRKRTISQANNQLIKMLGSKKAKRLFKTPPSSSPSKARDCLCGRMVQRFQRSCPRCQRADPWESGKEGS